jgi:hypothetical protein
VGEWGFYETGTTETVHGENINMNEEWVTRTMFQDIPRNDLHCHNTDAGSFVAGTLEDWTPGALQLNGIDQYCAIPDSELKTGYQWGRQAMPRQGRQRSGFITPGMRDSVDMETGNFLIEAVIAPDMGHTGSGIVTKLQDRGYSLELDEHGAVQLRLFFGTEESGRKSSVRINDGKWHHVIAEVDRSKPGGINLYVDGKLANGPWFGTLNSSASLSNKADFVLGCSVDHACFRGKIDFLRISKGTLAEAGTTIDELYDWEYDGPFLQDFTGRPASGNGRDAGAVEYVPG